MKTFIDPKDHALTASGSSAGAHDRQYPDDKLFVFHWRHLPKPDRGFGRDVADAFRRLGYGGGAIRALDYYEQPTPDPIEAEAESAIGMEQPR